MSLYHTYRPQTFDAVIGNEPLIHLLEEATAEKTRKNHMPFCLLAQLAAAKPPSPASLQTNWARREVITGKWIPLIFGALIRSGK